MLKNIFNNSRDDLQNDIVLDVKLAETKREWETTWRR